MIGKSFEEISGRDIELLVENAQQEKRTLEYKEKLPGTSDGDKREFLADVVSFATAAGGDIVFGISDKRDASERSTGTPEKIVGLAGLNLDAEILRIESMCRDAIQPRVAPLRMKAILDLKEGPVIVLRIPKSWISPHMMAYRGSQRFYSRNSAGKYPLDVAEIRAAFAVSDAFPERVRRFRDDRLAKIVADDLPIRLSSPGRVVLHLLHSRTFDPLLQMNWIEIANEQMPPLHASGWSSRINFDGLLTYAPMRDGLCQLHSAFSNGCC